MKRREFITLLGGAVAAPLALRSRAAQAQDGRVRRIAILSGGTQGTSLTPGSFGPFHEELAKLGWVEGRNLRVDYRFVMDSDRLHATAAELVNLAPELIVTNGSPATRVLEQQTDAIPIVFVGAGDPTATGLVKNVARPEGNATGFSNYYASLGGKWLELLREAAPHVSRIALLFQPDLSSGSYFPAFDEAAPALGLRTVRIAYHNHAEVEREIGAFATEPNGGLVYVPPSGLADPGTLFGRAAQLKLPTIGTLKLHAESGALLTYGADARGLNRGAATYVDRILRGAKVGDLPVQFPTKFELVVNLKTAKAIGLTIPEAFLLRADEIIE